MPRAPREKSSTGVYHVMLRGINRQIIFEDDEDYQKYLDTLKTWNTRGRFFCVVFFAARVRWYQAPRENWKLAGSLFGGSFFICIT